MACWASCLFAHARKQSLKQTNITANCTPPPLAAPHGDIRPNTWPDNLCLPPYSACVPCWSSSTSPRQACEEACSTPHKTVRTPHWPPSYAVLPRAVRPARRMRHAVVGFESNVSACFLQQVVSLNTKLVRYLLYITRSSSWRQSSKLPTSP
jgi:hypothetical protein